MRHGKLLAIEERRAKVLRYFAEHPDATVREAATALDMAPSTLDKDFHAATAQITERAREAWLGTIVARNEKLIGAMMPAAMNGKAMSAQTILMIHDQILKIFGLYAPTKTESTVNLRMAAEQIAEQLGLDPGDVLAEAERIIAAGGGG